MNPFVDRKAMSMAKQPMNFWSFSQNYNFKAPTNNQVGETETTTNPDLDKPIEVERTVPHQFSKIADQFNKILDAVSEIRREMELVNKDTSVVKSKEQQKALIDAYRKTRDILEATDEIVNAISDNFSGDVNSSKTEKKQPSKQDVLNNKY